LEHDATGRGDIRSAVPAGGRVPNLQVPAQSVPGTDSWLAFKPPSMMPGPSGFWQLQTPETQPLVQNMVAYVLSVAAEAVPHTLPVGAPDVPHVIHAGT